MLITINSLLTYCYCFRQSLLKLLRKKIPLKIWHPQKNFKNFSNPKETHWIHKLGKILDQWVFGPFMSTSQHLDIRQFKYIRP